MYVWCLLCTIYSGYFFHSFIVIWSIHKRAPDLFLKFMCIKLCRAFYSWPLSSVLELISCFNPLWIGGGRQDSAVNGDISNISYITSLPSPYMYLACSCTAWWVLAFMVLMACFVCSFTVPLKSKFSPFYKTRISSCEMNSRLERWDFCLLSVYKKINQNEAIKLTKLTWFGVIIQHPVNTCKCCSWKLNSGKN